MNRLLLSFLTATVVLASIVSAAPQRSVHKYDYNDYEDDMVFIDRIPKRKLRRSVKFMPKRNEKFEKLIREYDDYYADQGIAIEMVPQQKKRTEHQKHRKPNRHGHVARKRKFFDQERFFQ